MLKHGILGLLNYGDMTGYEISEAFKSSLNFFWPAQTSQIYRELNILADHGWIIKQTVTQSGKPSKNICSITPEGKEELRRWLADADVHIEMRSPVLMKLFFMGILPSKESLAFFRRLKEEAQASLEALQNTGSSISSYQEMIPDKKSALFWQMTADFGKRYTEMYQQWIDSCIRLIETQEEA